MKMLMMINENDDNHKEMIIMIKMAGAHQRRVPI